MIYKKFSDKALNEIMSDVYHLTAIYEGEVYKEVFKQIKLDGKYVPYVISNFGRCFSLYFGKSYTPNVRELKPIIDKYNGYVRQTINFDNIHYNCWIHRLVGLAFIPNPENKPEINHIDAIKTHNYIWNLEWNIRQENVNHAIKNNLTLNRPYGENNHSKMTENEVKKICDMILHDVPPSEIQRIMNIPDRRFKQILYHEKWRYLTDYYDFSGYKYSTSKKLRGIKS